MKNTGAEDKHMAHAVEEKDGSCTSDQFTHPAPWGLLIEQANVGQPPSTVESHQEECKLRRGLEK